MNIYEIDKQITALVDMDTGEILDIDKFSELQMERESKIEGMALWAKELSYEAASIDAEIKNLSERKSAAASKSEKLKQYIAFLLNGEKFKTSKCEVSYRKSKALEISDEAQLIEWAQVNGKEEILSYKAPTVSKKAVTELITSGENIPFSVVVERNNLQLK